MTRRRKYNKSRRDLFCYGCANSNDDDGFPGAPEYLSLQFSPCHMCMRNPDVQERVESGEPLLSTQFPDGSHPIALPMDLYCPQDMWDQHQVWLDEAVERETDRQLKADIAELKKEYGIS